MKSVKLFSIVIGILFASMAVIGCGDDGEGEGTPCEEMYKSICAKACECGEEACIYSEEDGGQTEMSDEAGCVDMMVEFSCEDEFDFAACTEAMADATCGADYFGDQALILPTECEGI